MRPLTSAALFALASISLGQAFGRFGYKAPPNIPCFELTAQGFRNKATGSDWLRYEPAGVRFQPAAISDWQATYLLSGGSGGPSKLRVNLYALGFELLFESGIALRSNALQSPFLSWRDGSVGPGVETPRTQWVLLSFRDQQPPVLLASTSASTWTVSGRPGDWVVRSANAKGWFRIVPPFGIVPQPANDAAALGRQVAHVKAHETFLTASPPKPIATQIAEESGALRAIQRFDAPGALVPSAVTFSRQGGYLISLLSGAAKLPHHSNEGPISYCKDSKLDLRFPAMPPMPSGRPVVLPKTADFAPATVSAFDAPSVIEGALAAFWSDRDRVSREAAEGAQADYLVGSLQEMEPYTRQRLPFDGNGQGLELAGAQSLLWSLLARGSETTFESNAMLTSLGWLLDSATWLPSIPNSEAAATGALGGILSARLDERLLACRLQAGLAADAPRKKWQAGLKLPSVAPLAQHYAAARRELFFGSGTGELARALLSPLRVLSKQQVSASVQGDVVLLRWKFAPGDPVEVRIAAPPGTTFLAQTNLEKVKILTREPWTLTFEPRGPGDCVLRARMPLGFRIPVRSGPIR